MSKFKKLMATMLGVILTTSPVLVSCSDDDETVFGAIGVNSLLTSSNSATAYWTIVPNGSLDSYKITILEGTRVNKGTTVIEQSFGPKDANGTFTGLKENTSYVITTQGVPAAGSGFTSADIYEMEFMTAPLVHNIQISSVVYSDIKEYDAEGNETIIKKGTVTATWTAIQENNCGSYTAALYHDVNGEWKAVTTITTDTKKGASDNSATFDKLLDPENRYYIAVRPNPHNGCWYRTGEYTNSAEFTTPAAE